MRTQDWVETSELWPWHRPTKFPASGVSLLSQCSNLAMQKPSDWTQYCRVRDLFGYSLRVHWIKPTCTQWAQKQSHWCQLLQPMLYMWICSEANIGYICEKHDANIESNSSRYSCHTVKYFQFCVHINNVSIKVFTKSEHVMWQLDTTNVWQNSLA